VVWFGLLRLFSALVDLIILQRRQRRPPRLTRSEKLALAVLTTKLKQVSRRSSHQLQPIVRLFKPETVLRWHRDLVARKWTFKRQNRGGRPRTEQSVLLILKRPTIYTIWLTPLLVLQPHLSG
jgi:hypothetical protein